MGKLYQVRYTVGDSTVAHEHYTEKGAKSDAKQLSKIIGNAMLGEIEINDEDGARALVRVWEFAGGEGGKAIPKDGSPPSDVKVIKTADDTKLPEDKVEKKPKAPRKSDEERLAEKAAEAQATLDQIKAGTYVLPTRGKKPGTTTGEPKERKAKVDVDKAAKFVEALGCTEETAKIITELGMTSVSRRVKVAAVVMDHKGSIFASQVANELNAKLGEGEEKIDVKEVMSCVIHVNYLFTREERPWTIIVRPVEGSNDKRFNFVPIKVEYEDDYEDDAEGKSAA